MADKQKPFGAFDDEDIREYGKINPTLTELIQLLDLRQRLPAVIPTRLSDSYGQYRPMRNEIELNSRLSPVKLENTLTHEMSHAVDATMDSAKVWEKDKPEFKVFLEQAKKLEPKTSVLAPKQDSYRHSNSELRAFGVGNSAAPKGNFDTPSPLHLDPTMATEAAILRDIFLRALKSKK